MGVIIPKMEIMIRVIPVTICNAAATYDTNASTLPTKGCDLSENELVELSVMNFEPSTPSDLFELSIILLSI